MYNDTRYRLILGADFLVPLKATLDFANKELRVPSPEGPIMRFQLYEKRQVNGTPTLELYRYWLRHPDFGMHGTSAAEALRLVKRCPDNGTGAQKANAKEKKSTVGTSAAVNAAHWEKFWRS